MTITGCACSTNASFDIPGSLTGNGDFWAEGSIVNNGCATPSLINPITLLQQVLLTRLCIQFLQAGVIKHTKLLEL
ncbi:MAG: hypothetical protein IPL42_08435 [Saprospiraceae bacterium]|nr:hypothetical protein [Saprospiraceae bacterium]